MLFKFAKELFGSDGYVLLPRHLRYSVVFFLAVTMIQIEKPYEPILPTDIEKDETLYLQEPLEHKTNNCEDYLKLLKEMMNNPDDDFDISEKEELIGLRKDLQKEYKEFH